MRPKLALPILLVLSLGLTVACQQKASSGSGDMSAAKYREELTKDSWTLANLEGGAADAASGEKMPSLTFMESGRVTGFTGCNPFSGTYTLEDGLRLRFSDLAVGLSACPASETERAFLDAVNATDNFTVNKGVLSLNVARRAPLATFKRDK